MMLRKNSTHHKITHLTPRVYRGKIKILKIDILVNKKVNATILMVS